MHIGIIMDGNRRWGRKNFKLPYQSYEKGLEAIKNAIEGSLENNVEYLSLYAFSTENWKRNKEETNLLKSLMLKIFNEEVDYFISLEIKCKFIGYYEEFGDEIKQSINHLEQKTKDFKKMTLIIALGYGSRYEILDAVNKILENREDYPSKLSQEEFSQLLYTKDIPDPNIIIRTGGEKRLSNFMLWQSSYSELIFYDFMWPEFTKNHIKEAIDIYSSREQRFGK